jgi:hypothetical protein
MGGVERVVVAAALVVVASLVAAALNRRRPQAPSPTGVPVPAQLDRADFPGPDLPWLLAVFTSTTCDSCARATGKTRLLVGVDPEAAGTPVVDAGEVAYVEVPWQTNKELHARYGVEDVPLILLADAEGVVRVSFVGTPEFGDLAGAVAAAREPAGSFEPGTPG